MFASTIPWSRPRASRCWATPQRERPAPVLAHDDPVIEIERVDERTQVLDVGRETVWNPTDRGLSDSPNPRRSGATTRNPDSPRMTLRHRKDQVGLPWTRSTGGPSPWSTKWSVRPIRMARRSNGIVAASHGGRSGGRWNGRTSVSPRRNEPGPPADPGPELGVGVCRQRSGPRTNRRTDRRTIGVQCQVDETTGRAGTGRELPVRRLGVDRGGQAVAGPHRRRLTVSVNRRSVQNPTSRCGARRRTRAARTRETPGHPRSRPPRPARRGGARTGTTPGPAGGPSSRAPLRPAG